MIIKVTITGESPLLCNRFTDEAMEKVEKRTASVVVGGRGTPREQAEKKVYGTTKAPAIPGPNIFRAIIDAGKFHKAGKTQITTAKTSLVPAGVALLEIECSLVPAAWEVDSRAVVNPATGGRMMAHRPRFDAWSLAFTLDVDEEMFDERIVRALVDDAGKKIGLGDFRPSRKGPFGRFKVTRWERQAATRAA
jgi:hypothetical protein